MGYLSVGWRKVRSNVAKERVKHDVQLASPQRPSRPTTQRELIAAFVG